MTAKMTKFCCHVTGQILRLYCFCIHLLKVPWLTTTYKPVIEDIVQVGLQSVLMIYLFFGYCSANKKNANGTNKSHTCAGYVVLHKTLGILNGECNVTILSVHSELLLL